jgi:tetratricopeptide (TPR) repeat protein
VSPKNKGKFGKGKSQVEETDEFVSGVQRIGRRLRPYAKKIAITMTVVVLGVLVLTVWGWLKDRKAKAGTEMYVAATDVMVRQVVAPDPVADDAGVPEVPTPDPADVENEIITYASLSEQAEAELAAIKALSSKYGGSPAAKQAKLLEARALLDLDRFDDAVAAYRAYAGKAPTELLGVLAREGEGYALEAKAVAQTDPSAREAGLKEALAAFQRMQPNETGLRRKHALYHEARLTATLGDNDKALELYRKILEIEPPADLEENVNARIASLEAGGAKSPSPTPETPEPAEPGSEGGE